MNNQENIPNVTLSSNYEDMLSNINSFVEDAKNSDLLTCDVECQENKTTDDAYLNLVSAENNLIDGPQLFEEAEKNYITLTKGNEYYQKFKSEEYDNEAKDIIKRINKKVINLFIDVETKLGINNAFSTSLKNTKELGESYSKKLSELKTDIADNNNDANIANRKSYYQNHKINTWCKVNYYLKLLFWFLFIGYVIIAIYSKEYTKYVKTVLILIPIFAALQGHAVYLYLMKIINIALTPVSILSSTLR